MGIRGSRDEMGVFLYGVFREGIFEEVVIELSCKREKFRYVNLGEEYFKKIGYRY